MRYRRIAVYFIGVPALVCLAGLLTAGTLHAQMFDDYVADRGNIQQSIRDRQAVVNAIKKEIAGLRQSIWRLEGEIKSRQSLVQDHDKAFKLYYDLKTTYSSPKEADAGLEAYPVNFPGGIIIDSLKDLEIYLRSIEDETLVAREGLELLSRDLEITKTSLKEKEGHLAKLERSVAHLQGQAEIEGPWTFSRPSNHSVISVLYDGKSQKFIGKFALVRRIRCSSVGETVFLLNDPRQDSAGAYIFEGTEYGYDENCGKTSGSLTIMVKGGKMMYRTSAKTYSLVRAPHGDYDWHWMDAFKDPQEREDLFFDDDLDDY
jgi:hypothetical protein